MRPKLTAALPVIAWLMCAGVLVQAILAGQSWFAAAGLFGLHGGVGHGVLGLSVITAVLAWWLRASRTAAALASLAVLLLVAQTGLGYVGHRTGVAAASAVHVPLGVTIFGLVVAVAVLLSMARPGRP